MKTKSSLVEEPSKKAFKSKKSQPIKVDLDVIDEKLKQLEESAATGNRKVKKKIRQLEFIKKRYNQMKNTQESLRLGGDDDVDDEPMEEEDESDEPQQMVEEDKKATMKGIKRFVVFVGNVPKSTTEDDIKTHFHKVGTVKSIRIPEAKETRKSGFVFVELADRDSFERALSMHHTMLGNKRINVLYTNPDGTNLDLKEIKRKNAKFDAMRKSGLLAGSVAEHKKRSFRRKKKRLAEAKASGSFKGRK